MLKRNSTSGPAHICLRELHRICSLHNRARRFFGATKGRTNRQLFPVGRESSGTPSLKTRERGMHDELQPLVDPSIVCVRHEAVWIVGDTCVSVWEVDSRFMGTIETTSSLISL